MIGFGALIGWPLANSLSDYALYRVFHIDGQNFKSTYPILSAIEFVLLWLLAISVVTLVAGLIVQSINGYKMKKKPPQSIWNMSFKRIKAEVPDAVKLLSPPFIGMVLFYVLIDFSRWTNNTIADNNIHVYEMAMLLDFHQNYLCKNIPSNQRILSITTGINSGKVLIANLENNNIIVSFVDCIQS